MMKIRYILLIFFWFIRISLISQTNDTVRLKYLSLGTKRVGICFGNSPYYSGLRFNFIDKNIERVNIFNFSLINSKANQSNGISLGLFLNNDLVNNGLSFACLGNTGEKRNGISVSILFTNISKINGIGLAGLGLMGDTLNGFLIGGFAISKWNSEDEIKQINGVAIALIGTGAEQINGLTISAINGSDRHRGLSIGLVNRTKNLKGVQIGIINYVGNNPRGLKWLPILNMHF